MSVANIAIETVLWHPAQGALLLGFRLRTHQQLPLGDETLPLCLLQLLLLHLSSLAGLSVPHFGAISVVLQEGSAL